MAKLEGSVQFTGSVGDLSFYKMKGTDKIVVRRKGGASKKRIKTDPKLDNIRRNAEEFAGCAMATKSIFDALHPLKHVCATRLFPLLNSMSKDVQLQDTTAARGERSVLYSQHRHRLQGFSLNGQKNVFDTAVRLPVLGTINRAAASAIVELPALLPDLHLALPWLHPWYRFTACLGLIADRRHNGHDYRERSSQGVTPVVAAHTEWQVSNSAFAATQLELKLKNVGKLPLKNMHTLVLAIGLEMGTISGDGEIEAARYVGCGKILTAG